MEHLFKLVDHHIKGASEWDSRGTLSILLDIINLLSRSDIKTELIKELERHSTTLAALEQNPGVDCQRLHIILKEINEYLTLLRDNSCQPGIALRDDELISSIKQRTAIPGGGCNFDLPNYYHWLHKPTIDKNRDFEKWQNDLLIIKKSVKLSLDMIRNSTNPSIEKAEKGFFQKPIESNVACQMIRIIVPANSIYFPEISGGKHRFTVRFMEQSSTAVRPSQTNDEVQFQLNCCIL